MATNFKARTNELYFILNKVKNTEDKIKIRNQIVELNIRLVSQVLKKYQPYTADSFQNGCIGLIKAAETYEISREVPFSSYACFCIEREIRLAYKQQQKQIESLIKEEYWVRLDATASLGNGDQVEVSALIWDEAASREMDEFIEENELQFVCNNIIKPAIRTISSRGRHMPVKVNINQWEDLEFAYIMDLIFIESQKQRFNLTQLAKEVGLSITNVRARHQRVMEIIFQRMWNYMILQFPELLVRLRGNNKLPKRLLSIDPGKTTGWALFEEGQLTTINFIENCYDDKNVDMASLLALMDDIKPDFILYEDYRVYSHKLSRHAYNPVFTVRLIGGIETYAQMHQIKTHKQMATTAKGFVTDDKLKQWGYWPTGKQMQHARDAIRHGCYFLLFHKKGQDLI